ncbi:MAG: hypothetical protein ABI655_01430 [Phenylobacterium sp.]
MLRTLLGAAAAATLAAGASAALAQAPSSQPSAPATQPAPTTATPPIQTPSDTPVPPTSATPPVQTPADKGAAVGANANASATASVISVGLAVKDNTGVTVGQVTGLKTDASGKQLATIKMGADSFTVEISKLALGEEAATINATQAQLKAMLKKPGA